MRLTEGPGSWGPIACLGVSPAELNEQVAGAIWARWVEAEPALSRVGCLEELHSLRGRDADAPFGALVRLAAKDGGDDQLAAIAVARQLEGGARHLMYSLRDLSDDIDAVVMGALWAEIRSFPWRRRTRAFAASLMYDTRASVMSLLLPGRTRRGPAPVVLMDPQSPVAERLVGSDSSCGWCGPSVTCEQSAVELVDLLGWALAARVIDRADALLLLDLVAAGDEVADVGTPRTLRGTCSQAAVLRVAAHRGVCGKTVMRQRDRVVATLRESAARYLAEVA